MANCRPHLWPHAGTNGDTLTNADSGPVDSTFYSAISISDRDPNIQPHNCSTEHDSYRTSQLCTHRSANVVAHTDIVAECSTHSFAHYSAKYSTDNVANSVTNSNSKRSTDDHAVGRSQRCAISYALIIADDSANYIAFCTADSDTIISPNNGANH